MQTEVLTKVEDFFSRYRLRDYDKGQVLLLNGDRGDYVFYLVSGKVKEYEVSPRGDEVILNLFKPPAFFPMSLAINKTPNPYIFAAETDIQVRQAPADEVVKFIKANPDVMFDLLARLYKGTDGLLARMARLMASSAKNRLIFEILLECKRFGEHGKNGSCQVKISESDLAARAGMTRETVSREVHKLIDENLLSLGGGTITVLDLKAFEKQLDNDK